jgi:putative ABC transport system ATP-binding protein
MAVNDKQIQCISVSKAYRGRNGIVNAVDDVNLSIRESEIVVIKGRSGAGKSTLLSMMSGLIKPTGGKIFIGEDCISELPDKSLSKLLSEKIGFIFQAFNLLPTYNIYENIELAAVPKGVGRNQLKDTIMWHLEQFGLKGKAMLLPTELSAGQQQKVAIIRSLIRQPSIIFADEPTGSVDDETAAEITGHLLGLREGKGITIVITTHGNLIEKNADRVLVMENGRIGNL